jgi:sulfite oxidase
MTSMNVKSLITWPAEGRRVNDGRREIRGVAWTGEGHVVKVEVATDKDPTWRLAEFVGELTRHGWRPWRIEWNARRPGPTVIRARATDSHGETQPEVTPWNKSGYLWNAIDSVRVEVT